jgi:hypothetical protein
MRKEEKNLLSSFVFPLLFVVVLWIIKGLEIHYNYFLPDYGIYPRTIEGLKGILLMPFIHSDIKHLFSNSIPLVILGACIIFFYKEVWLRVFLWIWLLDGVWVWLGGRSSWHIGASGLVYGLAAFLLLSGAIRREKQLMAVSLLVIFLYGGMVWGVFPFFIGMSWEAHLFGFIAGALLAYVYRKEGTQKPVYDWEKEEEEDIPFESYMSIESSNIELENPEGEIEIPKPIDLLNVPPLKIVYQFKEEKKENENTD